MKIPEQSYEKQEGLLFVNKKKQKNFMTLGRACETANASV
jgi:hypothetical protein